MKRIFIISTLLLSSAALAFSQKYDMKINLQPNLRVPLRSTNVISTKISIPGQGTQDVKTTTTTEVAFYVSGMKEGNYIINGIVNKRETISEQGGHKMVISGTDSVENQFNKNLIAITGKTFVAEITPKFELVGEAKPLNDDMTAKAAGEAFAVVYDFFAGIYPEKEVAKGESWEGEDKEQGLTTIATLTDVTETNYIIDIKIKLDQDYQGMTVKGEGVQNIEVNRELGLPIYGLATIPASGSASTPMGMISIDVNSIVSFELIQ